MTVDRNKPSHASQCPCTYCCLSRHIKDPEKKDPQRSPPGKFAGPTNLKITASSTRGPFGSETANLSLPQSSFHLTNTGKIPLDIKNIAVASLEHADTGKAVNSCLAAKSDKINLAPGESTLVTLSGKVPSAPSIYTSTVYVTPELGASFSTTIEVHIRALGFWGLACILVGLLLVGIINTLNHESGIQGKLHSALLARQEFNEFLQQRPIPLRHTDLVDNINRELDAAIAPLQKPRAPSFIDHRGDESDNHREKADLLINDLRGELDKIAPGTTEIADLVKEWQQLEGIFADLSKRFLTLAPNISTEASIQWLTTFNAWAAQRILEPSLTHYAPYFSYQLIRVKLLHKAGRIRDAVHQAKSVRRWMQRAAEVVLQQAQLLTFFQQQVANSLVKEAVIRKRLEKAQIDAEQNAHISNLLEKAKAMMESPFTWQIPEKFNQLILKASEELTKAQSDAAIAAAKQASIQESNESSLEKVEAVLDQGATLRRDADGKIIVEEKTAWLRRFSAAWEERLLTLPPPVPPAMFEELGKFDAAIDSNDIDALDKHMHELVNLWTDYSTKRAQLMVQSATIPSCLPLREDMLTELETTQQTMQWFEADPRLLVWESTLDRLLMKVKATPSHVEQMPPDCFDTMMKLNSATFQLFTEVSDAIWNSASIAEATKRQIAADTGKTLSPETLRSLVRSVRPLDIRVQTPSDEIYSGRQVSFEIGNIDPSWGPGVLVAINFGDGNFLTASAETLRKNKAVLHVYQNASSLKLTVMAAESFKADTIQPVGLPLGEGELYPFLVAPSPLSAKRQLADNLFNIRFVLALAIAAALYFWQFYIKKTVFGASRLDYIQAVSLGFATSVAVNNLPQAIIALFK